MRERKGCCARGRKGSRKKEEKGLCERKEKGIMREKRDAWGGTQFSIARHRLQEKWSLIWTKGIGFR